MALVTEALGEATFERAAALVAREHAAARQARPELPAGFGDAPPPLAEPAPRPSAETETTSACLPSS